AAAAAQTADSFIRPDASSTDSSNCASFVPSKAKADIAMLPTPHKTNNKATPRPLPSPSQAPPFDKTGQRQISQPCGPHRLKPA
ncbi:hypothetical protein ABRV50_13710, partial [Chromobacterium phragmitis]